MDTIIQPKKGFLFYFPALYNKTIKTNPLDNDFNFKHCEYTEIQYKLDIS